MNPPPLSDGWRRGVSTDTPDDVRRLLEAEEGRGFVVLPDRAAVAAFARSFGARGWRWVAHRQWVRGASRILVATVHEDPSLLLVGDRLDVCYLCPGTHPRVLEEVHNRLLATRPIRRRGAV